MQEESDKFVYNYLAEVDLLTMPFALAREALTMLATKLKGQITLNRQLIVEVPRDVAPGAVEVILLHAAPAKVTKRQTRRKAAHPAFGLWAKRTDLIDPAEYATQLRQKIELRADGNA